MLPVFVPQYYPAFRCIASACRHTCCVGWEIDVDETALARFDALARSGGPFADRLKAAIDREADPPCFILDEQERCPFLNANGLCDLITAYGEAALCQICTDHPRFRRVLPDRVELGLGLCCEAAAELILSQEQPMTIIQLPPADAAREPNADASLEELDPVTETLLRAREAILTVLTDRDRPLSDRIRHVLTALDIHLPIRAYADWAEFLSDMERLDPAWDDCMEALATLGDGADCMQAHEWDNDASAPCEHLLTYFLYRYLANQDERVAFGLSPTTLIRTRTAFAVLATALIRAVAQTSNLPLAEAARQFSSEIEYSEENLERFMDYLEENI